MATAFDDPHSELRNAQARFALQRAHAKLQGGDPVGALQVIADMPWIVCHVGNDAVRDIPSTGHRCMQDLLNITRQVGGDDAQTPLLQRCMSCRNTGMFEDARAKVSILVCVLPCTAKPY